MRAASCGDESTSCLGAVSTEVRWETLPDSKAKIGVLPLVPGGDGIVSLGWFSLGGGDGDLECKDDGLV